MSVIMVIMPITMSISMRVKPSLRKTLNSKSEILNKFKISNLNDQNGFKFWVFYCFGFRASNLGFLMLHENEIEVPVQNFIPPEERDDARDGQERAEGDARSPLFFIACQERKGDDKTEHIGERECDEYIRKPQDNAKKTSEDNIPRADPDSF